MKRKKKKGPGRQSMIRAGRTRMAADSLSHAHAHTHTVTDAHTHTHTKRRSAVVDIIKSPVCNPVKHRDCDA